MVRSHLRVWWRQAWFDSFWLWGKWILFWAAATRCTRFVPSGSANECDVFDNCAKCQFVSCQSQHQVFGALGRFLSLYFSLASVSLFSKQFIFNPLHHSLSFAPALILWSTKWAYFWNCNNATKPIIVVNCVRNCLLWSKSCVLKWSVAVVIKNTWCFLPAWYQRDPNTLHCWTHKV